MWRRMLTQSSCHCMNYVCSHTCHCQVHSMEMFPHLSSRKREGGDQTHLRPIHTNEKRLQCFSNLPTFSQPRNIPFACRPTKPEPVEHWKTPKNVRMDFISASTVRPVLKLASWGKLTLPDTFLPPEVCLPKSAKAGVKSGPRGNIRGSRVLNGNFGWLTWVVEQNKQGVAAITSLQTISAKQ